MAEEECEVAVIGAGPVGLTLALGLARGGRSVIVLEKASGTSGHSRAPIIWPRTQEVFAAFGVEGEILEHSLVLRAVRIVDADRSRRVLSFALRSLERYTDYPQVLLCPQSRTEAVLLSAVRRECGARVAFDSEVADVTGVYERSDFRVSAASLPLHIGPAPGRTTIRSGATDTAGLDLSFSYTPVHYLRGGEAHTVAARFAAGCDGAHSVVRASIGSRFEGITFGTKAALADIRFDRPQRLPFPRITRSRGVATAIRIEPRLWRLILPRRAGRREGLNRCIDGAVAGLFPDPDYEKVWQSEFRLHRRVCTRLRNGWIVLAGDAAHLTSPVGGQGMNTGIQDAAALTQTLIEASEGETTNRLESYVRQRRAATRRSVIRVTNNLTRILLAGGGAGLITLLRVLDLLLQWAPIRRRPLWRLAMLEDPSRPRPISE